MIPALLLLAAATLPPHQWVELRRDAAGARPGSAVRYVPDAGAFFLWGYMNDNPGLLQEHPLMPVPEADIVSFDAAEGFWRNLMPVAQAYVPRTYAGKTTGSERTLLRGPTEERGGLPRPDLNLVFDQVAYHPGLQSLVYFTGGLTAAFHVRERRWRDLKPAVSPPPVLGGSLVLDPVNDQLVLFGGGHVAERGPDGRLAGYTGLWVYRAGDNEWRRWPVVALPPPRMNTRLVADTRSRALVLFGGDAQSGYLNDTWLFDLRTLAWRRSNASPAPEARAGHFTVFDPETGWTIIGGGYNHRDLTDMWAYDPAKDHWRRLPGEVPPAFYHTADIAPQQRLIVLVASARAPGDTRACNVLYPVRITYGYRLDRPSTLPALPTRSPAAPAAAEPPPPRPPQPVTFPNQWVNLTDPTRTRPARTWGSATFDSARSLILYWGGGHCGYESNDVDAFDVETQSWRPPLGEAEHPERTWERGARLAGVTFGGAPFTEHGRRIYAFDPLSRKMILVRPVRLTTGYDPEPLRAFPARRAAPHDALLSTPSSYTRYATWSWDPDTGRWDLLGPAPAGLDTLVTTRHGVMGVNVEWPSRLNDAGYQLPPGTTHDTAIFLFDAARRAWTRLSDLGPSPQNLYEMTALAYDPQRDQVLLHGAGPRRDQLWAFEIAARRWRRLQPSGEPPPASREAVYIAGQNVLLLYGSSLWAYGLLDYTWRRVDAAPPADAGQNRAMVYDPARDLVFLILGARGDRGQASVYAMRYHRR